MRVPPDRLAPLELEVVTLIADGRTNGQIATRLDVGTVMTRVGRLPTKLALRDRLHAIIATYEYRHVVPGMWKSEGPTDRRPDALENHLPRTGVIRQQPCGSPGSAPATTQRPAARQPRSAAPRPHGPSRPVRPPSAPKIDLLHA